MPEPGLYEAADYPTPGTLGDNNNLDTVAEAAPATYTGEVLIWCIANLKNIGKILSKLIFCSWSVPAGAGPGLQLPAPAAGLQLGDQPVRGQAEAAHTRPGQRGQR